MIPLAIFLVCFLLAPARVATVHDAGVTCPGIMADGRTNDQCVSDVPMHVIWGWRLGNYSHSENGGGIAVAYSPVLIDVIGDFIIAVCAGILGYLLLARRRRDGT